MALPALPPSHATVFMCNLSDKPMRKQQTGSSLIELLIGIAIGLMVITAALGTLVLSRVTSLAVTDQLELQQQANTAMRIITSHLREANTRELELSAALPGVPGRQVQFSPFPTFTGSTLYVRGFPRDANGNDDFGVAYADAAAPRVPDCLGNTNAANGGVFVTVVIVIIVAVEVLFINVRFVMF